ncbi:hypothetical protein AB0M95_00550 [Sphaerisporangium sp. NPDC051017]|uniref:hypothetical protein n=1 Tax=Sphaerisporangium sp. NPDC051017 TaxID=3154636 RepID=UPI00342C35FC
MSGSSVRRLVAAGALCGAAGTTALYMVTYLDQIVRGRPSSGLPAQTTRKLAGLVGVDFGEDERARSREEGAGALLGILVGVGLGVVYGLLGGIVQRVPAPVAGVGLGLVATAAADAPMTLLGLTDPRTWGTGGWLSDLVPHVTYGLVTVYAFQMMAGERRSPRVRGR